MSETTCTVKQYITAVSLAEQRQICAVLAALCSQWQLRIIKFQGGSILELVRRPRVLQHNAECRSSIPLGYSGVDWNETGCFHMVECLRHNRNLLSLEIEGERDVGRPRSARETRALWKVLIFPAGDAVDCEIPDFAAADIARAIAASRTLVCLTIGQCMSKSSLFFFPGATGIAPGHVMGTRADGPGRRTDGGTFLWALLRDHHFSIGRQGNCSCTAVQQKHQIPENLHR